ncbi:hypothetical protein [Clostridium sp. J1101437_171009_A5]|uniref:hypothetical protein n=1 Tax=Clostridium sp. J1101437_171009_A5 TaxID=2787098 RepID=UPI001896ACC6|nr:hypothetical protein [Clostridium sp. J1101437_171009_A5]
MIMLNLRKRKRPILTLFLVVLFCFSVASCSKVNEQMTQNNGKNYTTGDTSSDSAVYITDDQSHILVSYIRNGLQQLEGEWGPGCQPLDILLENAPSPDSLVTVALPHIYDDIKSYTLGPIVTDGEWDFFPSEVVYTSYDMDAQPTQPAWIDYFKQSLDSQGFDGPIIISESYSFSWNGLDTNLVVATNVLQSDSSDRISSESLSITRTPSNSRPGVYILSALFIQGYEPIELFSEYNDIYSKDEETPWLGSSYFADDVVGSYSNHFISSVQYDEATSPSIFPIYCDHSGELNLRIFQYRPQYLICDIDGDAQTEVIERLNRDSSLLSYTRVYTLQNGKVAKRVHIGD